MHRTSKRYVIIAATLLLSSYCFLMTAYGQSTGGVKGKVRTSNGSGISGATVTARQKGSDIKSVTANGKGEFVLEGLESGLYNLVFDANGYSTGVLYNVEIKKKKIHDLGERLMLSTDKGTLVIVNGSVFYKEGTSVTAAKVELEKINSDGSTQKLGSGYTSSNGEFTFRLKPGDAKLRLTAKFNGVTGTKDIDVSEAAIYRLAITLDLSRNEK